MRNPPAALPAVLLGVFCAVSCASRTTLFGTPSSPYHKVLRKETREKRFFGLEKAEFLTNATRKTEAFRLAYVDEYARVYNLPAEKKQELLDRELAEDREYDVFVFSIFSTHRDGARLTQDPKVWRLSISTISREDPGAEPVSVNVLPTGRDTVLKYFYPYVNNWSGNYLVKFRKVPAGGKIFVHMTGVVADVLFEWNRPEGGTDGSGSGGPG